MKLYDHIDTARKIEGQPDGAIQEHAAGAPAEDKAQFALGLAKHLSESKPKPDAAVQLAAMPVSN